LWCCVVLNKRLISKCTQERSMSLTTTYRSMLREEMLGRLKRNASYSVRAFARDVELSPSFLSQILNQTRSLNEQRAFKMTQILNWPPDKSEQFINLVRLEKAKDPVLKKVIRNSLPKAKKNDQHILEKDQSEHIVSWMYFAVIELIALDGVRLTIRKISRRLNIPFIECQQIIVRLQDLGILCIQDGLVKPKKRNVVTEDDVPLKAGPKYHQSILRLAEEKIRNDKIEDREIRSMVLGTTPEKIVEAKRRIRQFERELVEFLEDGEKTAIYQLSTQYFRIDKE
jgi:uncharacterized protein (TIGR02147 family)